MTKNPENPSSVPKKEDPTVKQNDELGEDELNKVIGGAVDAFMYFQNYDKGGPIKPE